MENVHLKNEEHDYGINKRLAVYNFLGKHLNLKIENISKNGKVNEDFVTILDRKDLTYFNQEELASLIKEDAVYKVFVDSKKQE